MWFFCPRAENYADLDRASFERMVVTEVAPLLRGSWFEDGAGRDRSGAGTVTEPGTSPAPTYGGVPIRNAWHMLLYAWQRVREVERWHGEVVSARTLDAVLAAVLARLLEQRMRIGLGRDYVGVERALRGVRGRVDMARSIRERRFERGEAACRFTSFEADALRN